MKSIFDYKSPHWKHLQNSAGREQGFGCCGICGDTWNWKKPHSIKYSYNSGAFPFCEECEKHASNEEKMEAVEKLIEKWIKQSTIKNLPRTIMNGVKLYIKASELYKTNYKW